MLSLTGRLGMDYEESESARCQRMIDARMDHLKSLCFDKKDFESALEMTISEFEEIQDKKEKINHLDFCIKMKLLKR
jgi:hypothetical protein